MLLIPISAFANDNISMAHCARLDAHVNPVDAQAVLQTIHPPDLQPHPILVIQHHDVRAAGKNAPRAGQNQLP